MLRRKHQQKVSGMMNFWWQWVFPSRKFMTFQMKNVDIRRKFMNWVIPQYLCSSTKKVKHWSSSGSWIINSNPFSFSIFCRSTSPTLVDLLFVYMMNNHKKLLAYSFTFFHLQRCLKIDSKRRLSSFYKKHSGSFSIVMISLETLPLE